MSRLRWSDEDSLGGSLGGSLVDRDRYRYTPRTQDLSEQGPSSHTAGWRTGRYHRQTRDSPRQEYLSSSRSYHYRERTSHRYSDSDHHLTGERYSDRDLLNEHHHHQRYSNRELSNDHHLTGQRFSEGDLSNDHYQRYSDRGQSNDYHPNSTKNFTDLPTSHRTPSELNGRRNPVEIQGSHRNSTDPHSILVKGPGQPYQSFNNSNININPNSRSLSHSFLELQEEMLPSQSQLMERGRLKNQSLTFGVSEADLERAARTVLSDSAPFSLQMPSNSLRKVSRNSKTRLSLPDLFEGLNSPVRSSSVTFQSPMVSTAPASSLLPPPPPAPTSSPSVSQPTKEDETLKMLQRHYLQAILTLAPPHKLSEASTTIKNQAQAQALAAAKEENNLPSPPSQPGPPEEPSANPANPPPKMLDSILKMWEESQAENGRLRQDMADMRLELEATKQQLENAFQANSSVSDAEKEDRKAMERKLEEMEEKLKNLTVNNVAVAETEMTVTKLKEDNNRLREENAGLIKVMAKLSDCKK